MYIKVSNPNTQAVGVRVSEDEYVRVQFDDEGKARVKKDVGQTLIEKFDGIEEYHQENDEQEDED